MLINHQNGTYYGDNEHRCTVLDEQGKQYLMVRNFGLPSAEIVPVMVADDKGDYHFQNLTLDGVTSPIVDAGTGIQISFYNASGMLKTNSDPNIKLIDPETLTPINNTLPAQNRGFVIHWNSLSAEAPVPRQGLAGYQRGPSAVPVAVTPDYKSSRNKMKAQARRFTVTITTTSSSLHAGAIRLLEMKPDGSLGYIDDTGAGYGIGPDSLPSGPVSSLYAGAPGFFFGSTKDKGTHKHSVTITYPNMTTVSAVELACFAGSDAMPDNVTLNFTGIDGKEYQAARVTGFGCNPQPGAEVVLRLPLHDGYLDNIDIGPNITTYNEQTEIKAKITAKQPLSMSEFMTLWLPRSDAVQLAGLIAANKSAKECATVNKALTTRYYNMVVGALLVTG
ncbi:hypothetical protein CCP4SC76_390034 [Gammaproteobacteria bacterium]